MNNAYNLNLYIKNTTAHKGNIFMLWLVSFTYRFACLFVCWMVFNATARNISVISLQSVLLVDKTGAPRENHWPAVSHWQILSHNAVHLALMEIRTHTISDDRHRFHDYFYSLVWHSLLGHLKPFLLKKQYGHFAWKDKFLLLHVKFQTIKSF